MMLPSTCSSSMHRSTNLLFTLIVISITSSSKVLHALARQPQLVHAHGGGCIPAERAALLSFHKGITSDRTHVLASWHGQDCCRWRGVGCSNQTGHVIKLQLRHTIQYPYIYGYYYDACSDANSLFGEISASLLSLKHLEHLDLSMNCLLGPNSHIPRFLGFMDNLRYLNLSGMPFIGRVPPQLGNLSKLHHLHLGKGHPGSDGRVSGSYSIGRMYSTDITWLTELPLLEYLSMSGINLSRIVDWPHTLNMIPSLTVISLAGCSLDTASQSLPYLNLTKLEKLDLSLNNLGHSIASSWFWKVTSLRHLSLRGNQLFGNFPDALGNMTTLKVLDLSANNLNKTGNFKNVLKNLCCLEILDLSQNYMNGDIVTMIEGLPRCAREKLLELHFGENRFPGTLPNFIGEFSSLNTLDLSSDNLVGPIPPGLWNLMHLIILDLSWNQLNGNLPTEIGALTALTSLDITASNLIGNIPASLGKLKNLVTLSLSENNLTGSIPPEVMHSTSLITLDLSNNNLNGSIPAGLGKLKHLVTLSLAYNMITGPIPPEVMHSTSLITLDLSLNQLNGSMPAELGKLKRLATLYLRENKITGPIPREVMHSTSLITLDLSNNHISGSIPDELGKLKHLATLNLRDNNTAGPIPPEVMHSASLTTLDLSGNLLNGSIPAWLGKLKHLLTLDLSDNNLTGSIPREVMHLTSLTSLDLSSNHLYGSVPTELGSLKDLVSLDLSNNSLSGVITEEHFANLKSLDLIYLCSNNLKIVVDPDWRSPFRLGAANFASCQMGPLFPAWLQQPPGINSLNISSNSIKDKVPDWFWYTLSEASYLDISNNQISGSLPAHLGSMFFEELHLSSNQLTGSIPSFLGNITMLDISNNNFSGVIPSNFEASQLQMLLIYSNRVGGYIPESLCKLQQLVYLDLSNNFLEGEIPQCFEMQQMQYLLLGNNSLSGKFPAFLQSNTDLKFLDLAWNKLSGSLPTWIGDLGKLSFVLLDHNAFSDNIPVDITRLRNLQYLDLSANNFSGAIPWHLSNLTLMTKVQKKFMDMSDVSTGIIDTGGLIEMEMGAGHLGEILSVVTKGQHLVYGSTLVYFVSIDLSGNSLTGEIPPDITSLAALMNLNLSSNKFSGQIPNMIGAMQSLVSLDLSENMLSGEIPSSLSSLASLEALNLSYNNLSGRIPSGRQLDTLNSDNPSVMYIGNSELCGLPLRKSCSGNDSFITHGDLGRSKQEFDPLTFHFGLVLGLVVGFWMVFCALLFKKTWRIAYFRLLDEVYDHVYVFVVVKWASFAKNTTAE